MSLVCHKNKENLVAKAFKIVSSSFIFFVYFGALFRATTASVTAALNSDGISDIFCSCFLPLFFAFAL